MNKPLQVTSWGEGEARILALHGWGGSHETFLPLQPYIPESARVDSPDLPGYGSSRLPENWETGTVARMVLDSIDASKRFTIVGNCTGGVIGAEIAHIAPERVERLVMIDPFAYVPWYFRLFLKGGFGRKAYNATFASAVGRFFTNQAMRSKRDGETDLTGSFSRVNHDAVYSFLQMMAAHEGPARYSEMTLPIHIVIGQKTFSAVRKSVSQLEQVWPHATVDEVQEAGHLPIEEQSEQVARLVFSYG